MKILVVGYPRSGTSLTFRIFKDHPQVKSMLFETNILKRFESKKELLRNYNQFRHSCGEKVTWEKRVLGKIGKTDKTIIDYCLKWNMFFGKEAKIVQIVRHPFDSLNSLVLSKRRLPRGPSFKTDYREYLQYASDYMLQLSEIPNCFTIKYEDLLSAPKQKIKEMYKHCNLDASYKFTEKIKKQRAFNYKEKELLFKYDNRLENIINELNKIDGIEYGGR